MSKTLASMNEREAIDHCLEIVVTHDCSDQCRLDHSNLANWLEELLRLRSKCKDQSDVIETQNSTISDLVLENKKLKLLVDKLEGSIDYLSNLCNVKPNSIN